MAETAISDLSREQIDQLHRIICILGEPSFKEEIPEKVMVLETARVWYLKRQQEMRNG